MRITHGTKDGRWLTITVDGHEIAFDREADPHEIEQMLRELDHLRSVAQQTALSLKTALRHRREGWPAAR